MNGPDLWDAFEQAAQRISNQAQLRDLVAIVNNFTRRECGHCEHWMKSKQCPKEVNVNGWNKGPSMSEPPCAKYEVKQYVQREAAERQATANTFATTHNLPLPPTRPGHE